MVKTPTKKRPRRSVDAEGFRNLFAGLAKTLVSLPYPMDGGRRPELAIQCGPWYVKAKDGGEQVYAKAVMKAGFLAIHTSKKAALKDKWDLKDSQATSWAVQMTQRLQNLLRHCNQASRQEGGPPQWLKVIEAGGHVKAEPAGDSPVTAATQLEPDTQAGSFPQQPDETVLEEAEEEEGEVDEA